jgi:hypothetical protein
LSACWAFPLAAWNFYFQNCLSPFLAWANTPIINWGYLFIYWDNDMKGIPFYEVIAPIFSWKNLAVPKVKDLVLCRSDS